MRRVVILAFPGLQTLDVHGPAEVFSTATSLNRGDGYAVEVVAPEPGPVRTSSVALHPDGTIAACGGRIDTLLVPGGTGVVAACEDETLVAWVRAAAARSRRVASVCTGAFLLARAGLLDGRRATTHWSGCTELAGRHPEIEWTPIRSSCATAT